MDGRNIKVIFIILSLLIPWNLTVYGEEATRLADIEVKDTAINESAVKESASFVTIINPSEFKERLRDVGELLRESAGIQIRRSGSAGSPTTVSIRGSTSDQVAVFFDGVPLNRAQSGTVDLSNLPVGDVERIEVYRGTVPLQYGQGAIGGLINIVTKKAKHERTVSTEATYGSYDTFDGRLFYSQKWDRFGLTAFGNYARSDGDFKFETDNGTPSNPDDDEIVHRTNNDFESENFFTRFSYEAAEDLNLEFSNDFFHKYAGLPGTRRAQSRFARINTTRNISYLKLNKQRLGGTELGVDSKAYYIYQEERFKDRKGEVGTGRQDNENTTQTVGLNGMFTYPVNEWNLGNLYTECRFEQFRTKNVLPGSTDEGNQPQRRYTAIAGLSDDLYLFDERLVIQPLVLLTYFKNEFSGRLPFAVFTDLDDSTQDMLWDAKLGVRYKMTDYLTLKSNIGRFNRLPNFTELFGDRGGIVGNPELTPETGLNVDLGFIFERKNMGFLNRAYFEVAGFFSDVDDLIVFVQNSQLTFRAENVSSARIVGLEAEWAFTLFDRFIVSGNLTWQNPEDTSNAKLYNDNRLPGRAELSIFNRSELSFKYFRLFHELDLLSSNFIDRSNLREFDDRRIQNAGIIIYPLGKKDLSLTFEVKNFTDEHVEDIAGFPLPGRNYLGKITYSF